MQFANTLHGLKLGSELVQVWKCSGT